jgi:hypothetical protein
VELNTYNIALYLAVGAFTAAATTALAYVLNVATAEVSTEEGT